MDDTMNNGSGEEMDTLPEGQRIEIMKASHRLDSILDRLIESAPNIDRRALDAISIAASLLQQQLIQGSVFEYKEIEPEDGTTPSSVEMIKTEPQTGPAHKKNFKLLKEQETDNSTPSADELEQWMRGEFMEE